ncbi:hypothetical protein DL766_006804 [Monosporascus sp. MC13-8B]|uniref:Mannosyl-oligosaccharide glucosidase n=1 Tax=Monosporascus cannonballus TaxID=155416 RepID=A0ABY0H007_9PEZI|nr:hypothetical protein DL762_008481 [Monosporascus cannonballus]RYO90989.1 hypothetical protein DL763_005160 [Monosporascus cannonballus]RYP26131.1 hypothetical protein DL766_006804 [Monosporascus sp. MC13-8B]
MRIAALRLGHRNLLLLHLWPNLYFGVRPQVPDTLLMGMMWGQGQDKSTLVNTLHDTCEQDDGIEGYGWTMYDARIGGSQTIHDSPGHVDITTHFIKSEDEESWGVQVSARMRPDAPDRVKTAVVFHVALEKAANSDAKSLNCTNAKSEGAGKGIDATACYGTDPALGSFEFHVVGDASNRLVEGPAVKSSQVSEDEVWQAKSVFTKQVLAGAGNQAGYLVDAPDVGNMQFIQMVFEGAFTDCISHTPSSIAAFESSFRKRVNKVFPRAAPFDDVRHAGFGRALLSNLLGGLGFFHGNSKVDYTNATEYLETDPGFWEKATDAMGRATITDTQPASLLSHVPSRPMFPRGFLWDEGFHLLPVIEWDFDLAVSVLRSWLNLMDDDGWIAREQILGSEARSRVPEEFQVQYPHYANPPTLSLLFPILISKVNAARTYLGHPSKYFSSANETSAMLGELYPLLSRHYQWFRRTQAGNFTDLYPRPEDAIMGEGFRWRGRTPMHTLTSGLDDYPRANPPHPGELHVDALAWVGASAQALREVAEYLGEHSDAAMYGQHLHTVRHNLDALHWDPAEAAYCDTTIDVAGEFQRVCHLGYVSLLPLLLGLMEPNHPKLPAVLDLLADPARLWSPHGLRSLSAADPNYGRDEDYWRGAVWMNLNVLAVLRLRDLGRRDGPERARARLLAARLRRNVIDTVYDSWAKTGLFWEQYSDKTGAGQRSRAFTGWTACVILLLGLDLGEVPAGGRRGGASTGGISVAASMLSFLSLILLLVFRRTLSGLGASAMECWRTGGAKGLDRGAYEEVIDLDERDV